MQISAAPRTSSPTRGRPSWSTRRSRSTSTSSSRPPPLRDRAHRGDAHARRPRLGQPPARRAHGRRHPRQRGRAPGVREQRRCAPGDSIAVGSAVLTARATPGHRPEHLALVLSDRERSGEPLALLSGDALLVGEVGRPDLAVEPRAGAHALYAALRGLDDLDDAVELWPGHIGGSLCGGANLSQKPSSTLGYERRANPYLAIRDDERLRRPAARLAAAAAAPGGARRPSSISHARCPSCASRALLGAIELGAPAGCRRVVVDVRSADCLRCRPPRRRRQPAAAIRLDRHARGVAARRRAAARRSTARARRMRAARTGCSRPWASSASAASSAGTSRAGARRACRCGWGRRSIRSPLPVPSARGELSLLDVRDPAEWERFAIPRARRRALWQLEAGSPRASSRSRSSAPRAGVRRSPRASCRRACRSPCCASTAAWPTCSQRSRASPAHRLTSCAGSA